MPLKLYKRGKIWHFRGTVADERLRGTTRTADKALAARIANAKETRQLKGHLDGPAAVLTFAQAAIYYRLANKPDRFLRVVEDYWKDTLVKDITSGSVQQCALVLLPSASGATRNRNVIVPTQAIINYSAKLGHCPRLQVERFPVVRHERDYATAEWIEMFQRHAGPRIGALACFMFATAARIGEAIDVRWRDIDMGRRSVVIRQGKIGGDERRAHMPRDLRVAIGRIEGPREPDGRVFGYANRFAPVTEWDETIERAGIERMTFHACRHGFATGLLRKGVDVKTVAKLGGWKTAALVLSTYGHALDDPTLTNRLFEKLAHQEHSDDDDIAQVSGGYTE